MECIYGNITENLFTAGLQRALLKVKHEATRARKLKTSSLRRLTKEGIIVKLKVI